MGHFSHSRVEYSSQSSGADRIRVGERVISKRDGLSSLFHRPKQTTKMKKKTTIISKLHNYFIHKLVNPSDIAIIRKAVAYMDEKSMDFVTILSPGECIVSGTAFQMPTFV